MSLFNKLHILVLVIMLSVTPLFAQYPRPTFIHYPSVKTIANLGSFLSDIENHVDYSKTMHGENYRDNDKVTWGHESTHAINSVIRNSYQGSYGKINSFYLLSDNAVIITEPPVRISDVAPLVPTSLRGMSYSLYVGKQTSLDSKPLYLLDEWDAYTNGTLVGLELELNRSESTLQMTEFMIYAMTLTATVESHNRQTGRSYDDAQLKAFVRWQAERVMWICKQVEGTSMGSTKVSDYLYTLRTSQSTDVVNFRKFITWYFSEEWTKRIMGF